MHVSNEKKLAARATELGNSARPDAFGELAELVRSTSPLVRRLAASALGKLSGIVPPESAVEVLLPMLQDAHPQVRQYSAKALGAFGEAAKDALPDLRDLYKSPVELQKKIRTKDGTWVQSDGERRICEILDSGGIHYRYDERFRILDGYAIRPDFYLPEFDVYIEYWGMDTADYKIGMLKKQNIYQRQGKRLISLYPVDKPCLREMLLGKLEKLK